MMKQNLRPNILMADDGSDDRMLMKEAVEENNLPHLIVFVENGEESLDYLHGKGRFAQEKARKPNLIILDLNMPKVDGREALGYIKSNIELRRIPKAEEDIIKPMISVSIPLSVSLCDLKSW